MLVIFKVNLRLSLYNDIVKKGEDFMTQTNFKRYELKYILTKAQYETLLMTMPSEMQLDEYGRHKISNIYFDTEDFRIIRHSLEKPKYKEKLRVRCYGEPSDNSTVFIELKKKFNGVVYKRRVYDKQQNVFSYLFDDAETVENSQILGEIDYFKRSYNEIKPRVYLSYERDAYYSKLDDTFRLTFDFNIKTRDFDVSLYESAHDKQILSDDNVLLEVKTVMGLPAWFLQFLSENQIYKTSFSKYGTAYQTYFLPQFIDSLRRVDNA